MSHKRSNERRILCDETDPNLFSPGQVTRQWRYQLTGIERLKLDLAGFDRLRGCTGKNARFYCRRTWLCPRCWAGRAYVFAQQLVRHDVHIFHPVIRFHRFELPDLALLLRMLRDKMDKQRKGRPATAVYCMVPDEGHFAIRASLFVAGRHKRSVAEILKHLHYPMELLAASADDLATIWQTTDTRHSHSHFGNRRKGLIYDSGDPGAVDTAADRGDPGDGAVPGTPGIADM